MLSESAELSGPIIAIHQPTDLANTVRSVQDGNRKDYDDIYQATIMEMKGWMAYRCHSWDMVEECLQRTYITAYKNIQSFDADKQLLPWLKGIARNEVGKYLRESARRSNRDHKAFLKQQADAIMASGPIDDDKELTPQLAECLSRLGESLRTMIWRRYVEEKAVKDIATELGRTCNALSVSLHRARGALKKCPSKGAA